jgi:hypothetical protein
VDCYADASKMQDSKHAEFQRFQEDFACLDSQNIITLLGGVDVHPPTSPGPQCSEGATTQRQLAIITMGVEA